MQRRNDFSADQQSQASSMSASESDEEAACSYRDVRVTFTVPQPPCQFTNRHTDGESGTSFEAPTSIYTTVTYLTPNRLSRSQSVARSGRRSGGSQEQDVELDSGSDVTVTASPSVPRRSLSEQGVRTRPDDLASCYSDIPLLTAAQRAKNLVSSAKNTKQCDSKVLPTSEAEPKTTDTIAPSQAAIPTTSTTAGTQTEMDSDKSTLKASPSKLLILKNLSQKAVELSKNKSKQTRSPVKRISVNRFNVPSGINYNINMVTPPSPPPPPPPQTLPQTPEAFPQMPFQSPDFTPNILRFLPMNELFNRIHQYAANTTQGMKIRYPGQLSSKAIKKLSQKAPNDSLIARHNQLMQEQQKQRKEQLRQCRAVRNYLEDSYRYLQMATPQDLVLMRKQMRTIEAIGPWLRRTFIEIVEGAQKRMQLRYELSRAMANVKPAINVVKTRKKSSKADITITKATKKSTKGNSSVPTETTVTAVKIVKKSSKPTTGAKIVKAVKSSLKVVETTVELVKQAAKKKRMTKKIKKISTKTGEKTDEENKVADNDDEKKIKEGAKVIQIVVIDDLNDGENDAKKVEEEGKKTKKSKSLKPKKETKDQATETDDQQDQAPPPPPPPASGDNM